MTTTVTTTVTTAWRCSSCGQPVELHAAREHYNECVGGDPPEPDDDDDPDAA